MSLLNIGYYYAHYPVKFRGGLYGAYDRAQFNKPELMLSRFTNTHISDLCSIPVGYCGSYAIHPPLKAGGLGTTSKDINGSSNITGANLAGGKYGEVTIQGSGSLVSDISAKANLSSTISADGSLSAGIMGAVNIESQIYGTGEITEADVKAILPASATITAGGDIIDAGINAVVNIYSTITAEGNISYANLAGGMYISADIVDNAGQISNADLRGKGLIGAEIKIGGAELSVNVDEIVSGVWNADEQQYNQNGSMGELLHEAGSSTNPWDVDTEGHNTEGTFGWLMQAIHKIVKFLRVK